MGDEVTAQIIQCNQRKKYQNLIIPSSRFEMLNPYIGSQYTNTDFDMRRKAEILKYSNNASNSKTNNFTNNQRFSNIVQSINKSRNYAKSGNIKNIYIGDLTQYLDFYVIPSAIDYTCNTSTIIRKPSSNSDVPGNIELYEDTSVPLYKYKNFNNYAIVADIDNYNILINSDINVLLDDNNVVTKLYDIYSINSTQILSSVKFNIPISLYVKGDGIGIGSHQNEDSITRTISFEIESITFSLFYNPELYVGLPTSNYIIGQPITIDVNKEISIDISFQYHIEDNNYFQHIQYLDNIEVEIQDINTSNKFIYDIYVNSIINPTISSVFDFNTSYGIIYNVENDYDVSINTISSTNIPQYEIYNATSESNDVETIFKNKYFSDLNQLSQNLFQGQTDVSENIVLTQFTYVDVAKYYTEQVYQNVFLLKRTTLTNTIYNVEDIRYNPNVYYTLGIGTYYFVNISASHPIAILNDSLYNDVGGVKDYHIIYSNNNDIGYNEYIGNANNNFNSTETYQIGPESVYIDVNDPENGDYLFMYGVVKVEVIRDFGRASIYCYNHGFMGNRYLLHYNNY